MNGLPFLSEEFVINYEFTSYFAVFSKLKDFRREVSVERNIN